MTPNNPHPAPDEDGGPDKLWFILREPGCVPERKGPFPHSMTRPFVREVMDARPTAHITVLSIHGDDIEVQDGPEWLMMADGRSAPRARRHIASTRAAHGLQAGRRAPSHEVEPFEEGCTVQLKDAELRGTLLEFNAPCDGALIRWTTGEEIWKSLRNLEVVAPSIEAGELETAPTPDAKRLQDALTYGGNYWDALRDAPDFINLLRRLFSAPEPVWADLDGLEHFYTRLVVTAGHPEDNEPDGNDADLGQRAIALRHDLKAILAELRRLRQPQGEE